MQVTRLDIRHLRRFDQVQLSPTPGLNVLVGDNGAGKTSVLEALHLMAYGRSFRGRVRDGLVGQGAEAVEHILRGGTEFTFHGEMRDSLHPVQPPENPSGAPLNCAEEGAVVP